MPACAVTLVNNFTRPCRTQGGIAEIKVAAWRDPATTTGFANTNATVTLTGTALTDWFTLYCETKTGKVSIAGATDRQAGTYSYTQTVEWKYNALTTELITEMPLLQKDNLHVAVKMNSGKYYLIGYRYGAMFTPAFDSGVAYTDSTAVTGAFVADENEYPVFEISQAVYDALVN